ncbi:MAG: TIGR02757 family protein [Leptospiraceae bacterium]|nr:TIGR02757 family protein [Leptospiraceae bacterium]
MNFKRKFLDALANKYNDKTYLETDPIDFCYRYKNPRDIEVTGFISALFSYGNVLSIKKHLEILFEILGKSPYTFIKKGDFSKIETKIPKYRFQTSEDILIFLETISIALKKESSLEKLFYSKNVNALLNERIVNFQVHFSDIAKGFTGMKKLSYGLSFLIGSGILASSHKRYSMFLRWMVRDSFPDFGIYKSISKQDLIYPTDVHIVRLSRILGLSNRKSVDFILAKSISDNFKILNPYDPTCYDFALSRLGILKICKTKYVPTICENCEIKKICSIYARKDRG